MSKRDGLVWAAWAAGSLAALGALEGWALLTERKTLSRQVCDAAARWPLLTFFVGCAVGVLADHFWGGEESTGRR